MAKVLVLYYSMYGHIETMAHAVAEGANRVDGVEVVVKRVPETMQAEAFAKAGGKHKTPRSPPRRSSRTMMPLSSAPRPASAICPARCAPSSTRRAGFGPPARYTASWPACSALPARAAARSRRSLPLTTLAHHGMVIVPIGYGAQELFDVSQVRGGTPYGATTIAGGDGSRQPSNEELSIARYQGEYVAGLAKN